MTTELKPGDVEIIFFNSPNYGGIYVGDYLPVQPWQFPKSTWFQARLERVRKEQGREGK